MEPPGRSPLRMQRPQLAETEHHRKRQAGVANARVLGAPAVAPGAEAARSLDTCPTPSWGRAASQNPVAAAAGDPEPSGMEMGVAEGVRKEARRAGGLGGEGRVWDTPGPSGDALARELHCGKGAGRGWRPEWWVRA